MQNCDAVSSLTHLFTAAWALFATLVLWRLTRRHGPARWAVVGYGLSMVGLYLASGTFHGLLYLAATSADAGPRGEIVRSLWVFQRLDKSAIFVLIAGSYVPVFAYVLTGVWQKACFAAVAVITAAGVGSVWFAPHLPHPALVSIYIGMGLVGLAPFPFYLRAVGWRGMRWVGGTAVTYIGGGVVDIFQWPALVPGWFGPHEFLHVADMAGTFCHFTFVVGYVISRPPGDRTRVAAPPPGVLVRRDAGGLLPLGPVRRAEAAAAE